MSTRKRDVRQDLQRGPEDEDPTNEVPLLSGAAGPAASADGELVDSNVLTLRRLDAEIRRLMDNWVELERQLDERNAEIARLTAHARTLEQEAGAARQELAASHTEVERLRSETAALRAEIDIHRRQADGQRQAAEELRTDLGTARAQLREVTTRLEQALAGREESGRQLAEHRDALLGLSTQLQAYERSSRSHDRDKAELAARVADLQQRCEALGAQAKDAEAVAYANGQQLAESARRAEALEGDFRRRLQAGEEAISRLAAELESQRQRTEAAVNGLSRAEQLLQESQARVSELETEGARLRAQLHEQQSIAAAVDSEFQAKRKAIAAMGSELERLEAIQANVRRLDTLMSQQLGAGTTPAARRQDDQSRNGRLIVSLDGPRAMKYPLYKADMVIGRGQDTDIRVTGRHTSRRHARIHLDDGAVIIEDLGSLNGILVNNESVSRTELHHGDVVDIGGARLRYVDLGQQGAEAEPAPAH